MNARHSVPIRGGREAKGLARAATGAVTGHEKSRPRNAGGFALDGSGGLNVLRPGTLRVLLDVEADLLAADEAVEVDRRGEPVAVEEVVLPVVGGDEAEAAVRDELLDGAGSHGDSWISRTTYCRRTVGSRADHTEHATTLGRASRLARRAVLAGSAGRDARRTPSADDAATCWAGSRRLNCRGARRDGRG